MSTRRSFEWPTFRIPFRVGIEKANLGQVKLTADEREAGNVFSLIPRHSCRT